MGAAAVAAAAFLAGGMAVAVAREPPGNCRLSHRLAGAAGAVAAAFLAGVAVGGRGRGRDRRGAVL